jgi:hypothetical protein
VTASEGKAVATLLNFIFLSKGYDMRSLERDCAMLAKSGKVPGWTETKVHREAIPSWLR